MPNTVTESIYSGKNVIVPLADVQHIETGNALGLMVVTKHTRWDNDAGGWANAIWIDGDQAQTFKAAWCRYRSELEAAMLADLTAACDECGGTGTVFRKYDDAPIGCWACSPQPQRR